MPQNLVGSGPLSTVFEIAFLVQTISSLLVELFAVSFDQGKAKGKDNPLAPNCIRIKETLWQTYEFVLEESTIFFQVFR